MGRPKEIYGFPILWLTVLGQEVDQKEHGRK